MGHTCIHVHVASIWHLRAVLACFGGGCRLHGARSVFLASIGQGLGDFGGAKCVLYAGGLWAVSKAGPWRAYVLRLLRFILLVNFSDTILLVSILVIETMIAICGRFCSPEGVNETRFSNI